MFILQILKELDNNGNRYEQFLNLTVDTFQIIYKKIIFSVGTFFSQNLAQNGMAHIPILQHLGSL